MLHPRSLRDRYIKLVITSICLLLGLWWFTNGSRASVGITAHDEFTRHRAQVHLPLDDVIHKAQRAQESRLSERRTGLSAAASAYRSRRGRHPPPGFDKWHARAVKSQAMVVESFFDQIYEDPEPFWGMAPVNIRSSLTGWQWTLRIRAGKVKDVPQGRFRSRVWGDMIQRIAVDLPDMDVAINPLDEPRVFTPWSKIDSLVKSASLQRHRTMSQPTDKMLRRQSMPMAANTLKPPANHTWIKKGSLWPHLLETCDPSRLELKFDQHVPQYTSNWTTMKDICANHYWADLHGSLTRPATMDITTDLVPLFSAAKLQGSNDILLPPPSYYTDDALFTGNSWFGDGKGSVAWSKKIHGLVWRGKATGGHLQNSSWHNSHRQRLVSKLNASNPSPVWDGDSTQWLGSENAQVDNLSLAKWLGSVASVGFTDLLCSKNTGQACRALSDHFSLLSPLAMRRQYRWKYLPDIDGNSLSGRFMAFLGSNSAPMKATIFKEWHDSRLMPWVHFIPLDITLRDLWHTMAYFLGFEEMQIQAHDSEGERIAAEGRSWAKSVLRKEDMELYVHRVLLEYARLCDDERDSLGFVEDLQAGRSGPGVHK